MFGSWGLKIGELREFIWLFKKNKILFLEIRFFETFFLGLQKKIWKNLKFSEIQIFQNLGFSKFPRFFFAKPKQNIEKIDISAQNRGYMVRPPKNDCLDVKRDQRRICVPKISFLANSYAENGPNEDLRFFDFVNPITIWDSFSYWNSEKKIPLMAFCKIWLKWS